MTTKPMKLVYLNDYRARLVRLSVIEEIARNLRAVQDYIDDHDAEFQSESGIYVREYIGEMVSDTDEILNPVLEVKEAA